ncbi:MAG: glycosyltransferase family 2 protein [Actinomycetota bacterium]
MSVDEPAPLSVVILTFNEEANLARCLESTAPWAAEVFVVDSGSTDQTVAIAERYGARVFEHSFENHVAQWQWALDNLPFGHEWMLAIDADFAVTPELRDAITAIAIGGGDAAGYYVRKRFIFRGRFIRHGGVYPNYRVVLFRRDAVFLDESEIQDHHFYVHGRTGRLEQELIEINANDDVMAFWIDKQLSSAERQAMEEIRHRRGGAGGPVKATPFGHHNQRVLWLEGIWSRLPLYWRSVFYFLYRYVLRGGFLDGRQGFLYHFTQALVYRILLDARIEEQRDQGLRASPAEPDSGERDVDVEGSQAGPEASAH